MKVIQLAKILLIITLLSNSFESRLMNRFLGDYPKGSLEEDSENKLIEINKT